MFPITNRKIVIYAEGRFNAKRAKVAASFLRYHAADCVAVIDSVQAGSTVQDVLGYAGDIPVVASLAAVLEQGPEVFMIGNGLFDNFLPEPYRAEIMLALEHGMDVVSGLHFRIANDPQLAPIASKSGARIWDTKEPPENMVTSQNRVAELDKLVVHTVGSDCRVGKKTTALELTAALTARGERAAFAATGQSGIYISGRGIAIDAVPGDFIAGMTESLVLECGEGNDIVVVEGQGSISHPAYSAVTLGLLHGAMPQALILCHEAGLDHHKDWPQIPLRPLSELISLYEQLGSHMRPARVIGISVNCADLDEASAAAEVARIEAETGLPTTDVIRFGAEKLADAVLRLRDALPAFTELSRAAGATVASMREVA